MDFSLATTDSLIFKLFQEAVHKGGFLGVAYCTTHVLEVEECHALNGSTLDTAIGQGLTGTYMQKTHVPASACSISRKLFLEMT